ncbi:MAG: GspE/PulE family protein [bacterium]|nr:GspE/PulE family protein [bacterium]
MESPRQNIAGDVHIESSLLEELRGLSLPAFDAFLKEALLKDVSGSLVALLGGAIAFESSDVHMESEENGAKIRFRIDGLLEDVAHITPEHYRVLLSRIKLLSGLKLNVADRPQDGRFSLAKDGQEIEVRTSSLPSEHGESLVLRILDPKNFVALEDFGLRDDMLSLFTEEISKPNGMIVVTGPTGAGKTTTLYAFLQKIQKPELKIVTIEDPIEYHIEGVSQTQANPAKGYDFASGLRAIVRQDPDVILVGEIRDGETADIALQASLTGHLVLSTLHTNEAAGTPGRLVSLGAKPVNIAPALNLAIAQRLLRKVCDKCSEKKPADQKTLELLEKELENLPASLKPKLSKATQIPHAKKCPSCNSTGYKGRIGVFEAIALDDELRELILSSPSLPQFKSLAVKKGMIPLRQDGLLKVLEGLTTMEEVERVTKE